MARKRAAKQKQQTGDPPSTASSKTGAGKSSKGATAEKKRKSGATALQPARAKPSPRDSNEFPIVGVGASAGGLEAMEEFFSNVPPDCGIGFVVVTHQHPGHTSLLPELLGKKTGMPVVEATDGVRVEPNRVYVGPPGGHLVIIGGTLQFMQPQEPADVRLPIDYFFRSLARDRQDQAVCIVLSGTGTDGTLGLREIKGVAGMAMVQEPQSARYPGMPSSAIMTNLVDFTLPPAEMPRELIRYVDGLRTRPAEPQVREELFPARPLGALLALLRLRTGHDFSGYKPNTIHRRVERRMNVHQIEDPARYLRYLQENPHELDILFKELLINVTSFFRDAEAFESLAGVLERDLLPAKSDGYSLRVWVPGCGSGEEAYSIAILLKECMERLKTALSVQIFATDLDAEAINSARGGSYPDGIAVDVSKPRLNRFFTRQDDGYRVGKEIREMVVFAPHNVLQDPPFTKLDLLSCRNVLIYLQPELQRQLLPMFHYALRPSGLLFLGPSETISASPELFEAVDKKWKIFRRVETAIVQPLPEFPARRARAGISVEPAAPAEAAAPPHLTTTIERALLARYAPASVIVNERGDILYVHGRTGAFLEPAGGQARMNVLEMAREGLRLELAAALRQAAKGTEVLHEGVRVKANGESVLLDLSVARLNEPEALRGLSLVSFRPLSVEKEEAAGKRKVKAPKTKREQTRVAELERELQYTKESLQSTVEELETSNEELKSTNEELQSTNEELQSTNEELETSREEMQSLNEELTTVNTELQSKVEDLSQTNDDMQNLLNSTEIATIFLDNKLNIKRFTKTARRLVHLIDTDVGRPIADLVNDLQYRNLAADAEEVLRTLAFKEVEVQTTAGDWCLMRLVPYRTAGNVIDGLVVTFIDINKQKQSEQAFDRTRGKLAGAHSPAVLYSREPQADFRTTYICENVAELTEFKPHEFVERPGLWVERIHPDDRPRVLEALQQAGEAPLHELLYRFSRKDDGQVWLCDQFKLVRDKQGQPLEIVGALSQAEPPRPDSERQPNGPG